MTFTGINMEVSVDWDQPFKNPDLPVAERVEDLLARMSLEEKLGQMTLIEKESITNEEITDLFIGGLLSGGGGSPEDNSAAAWAAMVDGFQQGALQTDLGIPLIYGVDAVHGHGNLALKQQSDKKQRPTYNSMRQNSIIFIP